MCISNDLLKKYQEYLEKLAAEKSPELFSNGGIENASILMSVLLKNTEREARIFCEGLKPELNTKNPYLQTIKEYLKDENKSIKVLVESDNYVNEEPFKILREAKNNRKDNSVEFKLIKKEDRIHIFEQFNKDHCNFAVYDSDKFRFEYSPKEYKAFGSFNDPEKSGILITLFDEVFNNATDLQ